MQCHVALSDVAFATDSVAHVGDGLVFVGFLGNSEEGLYLGFYVHHIL